ncbi:HNH endonuclease [Vibrio sp. S12_S33]|uniref:HNH endonuclease n=1 Tax=Vibrio sp. S12_S33 TaxID=2720223 RepID=UPI0017851CF5|nr:HNH endonuclease signature motif containing protein [Vibrio sp. S12_S33]MBD1566422.1 HNH endonuclease [Vibrio sp. S12_S33]
MASASEKIAYRREYILSLISAGHSIVDEAGINELAEKFECSKKTIKQDILLQRASFDDDALGEIVKLKWNGCRKRAELYGVKNDLDYNQLLHLYLLSIGTCNYCKQQLHNRAQLVVDHVIPMVKGGSNSIDNVILSCWLCNIKKGDKILD